MSWVWLIKNPGTSWWLMGSSTSSSPWVASKRAATLALRTVVCQASAAQQCVGCKPTKQLRRGTPKACAYAKATGRLFKNASIRIGSQASPRSPAAQSPAGKLCNTMGRPLAFKALATSCALWV